MTIKAFRNRLSAMASTSKQLGWKRPFVSSLYDPMHPKADTSGYIVVVMAVSEGDHREHILHENGLFRPFGR